MKRLQLFFCLVLLPLLCYAQSYTYLGVNDGLSHRHVYSIQKDAQGYMWFLTYEGVDRFNGSEFKHYDISYRGQQLSTAVHLRNLFYTPDQKLWQIGADGKVFLFNHQTDQFDFFYEYPSDTEDIALLDFSYIDTQHRIWMSYKGNLHIYNYKDNKPINISQHPLYATTTAVEIGQDEYAIGTTHGVFRARIKEDSLQLETSSFLIDKLPMRIEKLYYHEATQTLLIASLKQGIFAYDLSEQKFRSQFDLQMTSVNRIITYSDNEVLVATNGAGIYLINLSKDEVKPFIQADYDKPNAMKSNSVKDIFLDDYRRIWMATYPAGISIRSSKNKSYDWIKHIPKYDQSLVHNEVNHVLEDSEGDIWFATANGVSLYRVKEDKWETYLSSYNKNAPISNHIFLSLVELTPGIIWVGGYNSGVYKINKRTRQSELLLSNEVQHIDLPDKCIRAILRDKDQNIWMGGYYNLKLYSPAEERLRYYSNLNSITSLVEKDSNSIWIGSAKGLYLLDKKSGDSRQIDLPTQSAYIHALHQDANETLYIGTNEGLLIFKPHMGSFEHLHKDNSLFFTNSIRSIVADSNSPTLYIGTDRGLSKVNTETLEIKNWTKDQGLLTTFFNSNAGTQLQNGSFLFGSAEGAVRFSRNSLITADYTSKLVLEELKVGQQAIHPLDDTGILTDVLDRTNQIKLKSKQGNITIKVGSINYDYPSNILYQWKLEGLSEEWSKPSSNTVFSFSNLQAGTYLFKLRTIPRDANQKVLEERQLAIEVLHPIWWGTFARILYILLILTALVLFIKYLIQRNEQKLVDHTKRFYYNTAHDIKVPLRLIKEPILEISETESLTPKGEDNLRVVLRNLNTLLAQNDNAINYERMEKNRSKLYLSEHHLIPFISRLVKQVYALAELKQVKVEFKSAPQDEKVWIDKDKVQTIINNILHIAIDRSPDFSTVTVSVEFNNDQWIVKVNHGGECFTKEQLDGFEKGGCIDEAIYHNKCIQKELGLQLVCQLVNVHKGTAKLESTDKEGTTFTLCFPVYIQVNEKSSSKALLDLIKLPNSDPKADKDKTDEKLENNFLTQSTIKPDGSKPKLLLVEDDQELIADIQEALADEYNIHTVDTAKAALQITKQINPDIIIAKMVLGDMKGTDLSLTLKADLDTSHIPIILITDKNDEKHILKGLQNGADEFILKPFNYRILKASMANLLANRAILRDKYANLDIQEEPIDCVNCSTSLDREFIASVKEKVEEHMSESDFTVDTLCSLLNMSRTSFYNKLKALTNKTPSDYIRLIKLNHAAELLLTKEYTITEIADRTGFNDAKYFREVFKKHYKVTPSKYAKENSR